MSSPREIMVWDLPTRLFHWLLAALVAFALGGGFRGRESWLGLHVAAGLGVAALLLFRAAWAFHGFEYSRLDRFTYGPAALLDHLRALLRLRPTWHAGHNPAGAVMIFALALVLVVMVASGLMVLGGEEKQGPLAGFLTYAAGHAAKEVHEALAWLLLVMIAGHLGGVALDSALTRDALVRAMVTGRKRLPADQSEPPPRPARSRAALRVWALASATVAVPLAALLTLPPLGWRPLAAPPAYGKECGACHDAFHPSLLPESSWRRVMAGLDDHFGEDARLEPALTEALAAWLGSNAAETFDTEAANRLRVISTDEPRRVTRTPFWVRKHASLPTALFARKSVGGKTQCSACHQDAASGRFDDQAIAIPKE